MATKLTRDVTWEIDEQANLVGYQVGNQKGSLSSVSGAGKFYVNMPTYEAIMAAVDAARAAGGGNIIYGPHDHPIGNRTIRKYSNVRHVGSGPQVLYLGTSVVGGTRITGDGTAPAFAFNEVDSGVAPSDVNAFVNGALNNSGVTGMAISNVTYGIKIGAKNQIGCSNSHFENLVFTDVSQWGFHCTNFFLSQFHNIRTERHGVGGIGFFNDDNGIYNGGNSDASMLCVNMSGIKSRGIVFKALNGAINQFNCTSISSFGSGAANIAVNATSNTSGTVLPDGYTSSQHLAVPSASVFAVDMPAWLSAGISPVAQDTPIFVTSVDSVNNRITVALTQGGTPITFTAATTVTINSAGFPKLEFVGVGAGQIQSSKFAGADLETPTTALALLQNTSGVYLEAQFVSVTDKFGWIGISAANGFLSTPLGGNLTFDNNSNSTEVKGGIHARLGSCWGGGFRQIFDSSLTTSKGIATGIAGGMLNIRSYSNGLNMPDFYINNQSNMLGLGRGLVVQQVEFGSTTDFDSFQPANPAYNYVYNGAGGGTATMPSIVASGSGQNVGLVMCISNPSSGTLTLSPKTGGQNFDNSGTTFVMPANSSSQFIASKVNGTLYWARYR